MCDWAGQSVDMRSIAWRTRPGEVLVYTQLQGRPGPGEAYPVIPIYPCSPSLPTPYLLYEDLY